MSCQREFDDIPIIQIPSNPANAIDVRGIGNLQFTVTYEQGVKVFTGEIVEYLLPLITAEVNPVREVGQLVDFTWNLNIVQKTKPIASKTITPADYSLDSLPVAVIVDDVTRSTRGFEQKYSVSVVDNIGGSASRLLGITFYNKVFTGFSYKDGVTAGQILTGADILAMSGVLASDIKAGYGGVRNYNVPVSALQQYVYWAYEVGTTPIAAIEMSNLPFPFVVIPGSIPVTNPHNGAIITNYVLVRSANKFSNGTLQLNML